MTELADPTAPLTASGNLRRREVVSKCAEGGAIAAAIVAVGVLGLVIYGVISRGASVLSFGFLTKDLPEPLSAGGGGVGPALVGTAELALVATIIAAPVAILTALYLVEFAGPRTARPIRLVLDLMYGLPSIIVAVFIFGLIVKGHHESGFAAAVALSIIMAPLIARSTQEMLLLVPKPMREAADALGVSRWRSVVGIILPAASGGIVTGTILAVARAAGETAPVLILSSVFENKTTLNLFGKAVPNIPVLIFNLSEEANPLGFKLAWGAAFVLLVGILVANLGARVLLARSRAKIGR
jgi:phosphate transport system permease protein